MNLHFYTSPIAFAFVFQLTVVVGCSSEDSQTDRRIQVEESDTEQTSNSEVIVDRMSDEEDGENSDSDSQNENNSEIPSEEQLPPQGPTGTPAPDLPSSTEAPQQTEMPTATEAPQPSPSPSLTPTEAPTATPSSSPENTPTPTSTPTGTDMPIPTASPEPTETSAPLESPMPTTSPTETTTPTQTSMPTPTPTSMPTMTPTPSPSPTDADGMPSTEITFGNDVVYHLGDGDFSNSSCIKEIKEYPVVGSKFYFEFEVLDDDTVIDIEVEKVCGVDYAESNVIYVLSPDQYALARTTLLKSDKSKSIKQLKLKAGLHAFTAFSMKNSNYQNDRDDFVVGQIKVKASKPVIKGDIRTE
jgi:hypothetical protein